MFRCFRLVEIELNKRNVSYAIDYGSYDNGNNNSNDNIDHGDNDSKALIMTIIPARILIEYK